MGSGTCRIVWWLALALAVDAGFACAQQTLSSVVSGQVSMSRQGSTLNITNTPGSIIQWQQLSIAQSERVNFNQQSAASTVLNRVIGTDPSVILGTLWSNGRVFLVNPNGILFGAGAQIDVAGLVASTLNLSNADFLAGRLRFVDTPGAGSVVNQGRITTPTGGTVYLIAPDVQNSGVITSPQGEIILAAGKTVELVASDTLNLRVEITAPDNQALNVGQIIADSGRVGIYAGLIRNSGTIRADGVVVGQGGEILLRATKTVNADAGDISAANIQVTAGDSVSFGGIVTIGGGLTIDPVGTAPAPVLGGTLDLLPVAPQGTVALDGGNVTLNSPGGLFVNLVQSVQSGVTMVQSKQPVGTSGRPTGGTVINGLATFSQQNGVLNLTNSSSGILNWQNFSIGANDVTNFIRQNSSAVLNHVTTADPSVILGSLQSNGQVYLINPNGVVLNGSIVTTSTTTAQPPVTFQSGAISIAP